MTNSDEEIRKLKIEAMRNICKVVVRYITQVCFNGPNISCVDLRSLLKKAKLPHTHWPESHLTQEAVSNILAQVISEHTETIYEGRCSYSIDGDSHLITVSLLRRFYVQN